MKFELRKASDYKLMKTVVINTLEDLKALEDEHEAELIINFEEHRIVVYDDYME